jgi:hypothetical protein
MSEFPTSIRIPQVCRNEKHNSLCHWQWCIFIPVVDGVYVYIFRFGFWFTGKGKKGGEPESELKQYMDQMDRELASSSMGQSFEKVTSSKAKVKV